MRNAKVFYLAVFQYETRTRENRLETCQPTLCQVFIVALLSKLIRLHLCTISNLISKWQ